ncbi:imidazole glycerol phosphate synthase subunit HisH [Glaciecola siphonariae]|uniref:Imidazole glycerol phosphate synthase subunit HisH n=1 Tax=Glaciecola siphonariae TaxID=521012 RepID=A0ABV9M236_9ALTE
MPQKQITIINTGCANISSVRFAFERLGVNVLVTDNTEKIAAAERLVLPGVGSAPAAMNSIKAKGLLSCIQALEQPVLGVCLGMQIMVERSQENDLGNVAATECLNLIPGEVKRMHAQGLRIPHMGWNEVSSLSDNALFAGIPNGTHFYFVHSFAVNPYAHTLATCSYGDEFSAAIHKDNFYGVQFHPERSSDAGAQLLTNFLNL